MFNNVIISTTFRSIAHYHSSYRISTQLRKNWDCDYKLYIALVLHENLIGFILLSSTNA